MFGENAPNQQGPSNLVGANQAMISGGLTSTLSPPSEYGVSSAMGDLIQQVREAKGQSEELRSVLGISVPDQGSKVPDGDTLVGSLATLTGTLRATNANLQDCLRHLRT